MPPVAMALAKVMVPSPTALGFATAIQDEKDGWPTWDERVDNVMMRFLDGEFETTMAPANVEVVALLEAEKEETALYERHFARLFQAYRQQARAYERAGAVAPTVAARVLSMALAGTDEFHDREFAAAAARYREAMLTTLNSELAQSGRFNTFDYVRGRDLWEKVPAFDYDVPALRDVMAARWWSIMVLGAWLLASLAAAVWGVSSMTLGPA
jgi:ABC-2 type transport system permease protein